MKQSTKEQPPENPLTLNVLPAATPDWEDVIDYLLTDEQMKKNSSATGQIQWHDLDSMARFIQNVSNSRWSSGILIDDDHFLTAGHSFDVYQQDLTDPSKYFTPFDTKKKKYLEPTQLCKFMKVNFNYQSDGSVNAPDPAINEMSFDVVELVEYKINDLDYAIVKLKDSPGKYFGYVSIRLPSHASQFNTYVIHHPMGLTKKISHSKLESFTVTHKPEEIQHAMDTEGGSSGAGIFDNDTHHLIAVHTHGTSAYTNKNTGVYTSAIYEVSPFLKQIVQSDPALKTQYLEKIKKEKQTAVLIGALVGGGLGFFTVKATRMSGTTKQIVTVGVLATVGATTAYLVKQKQQEESKDDDYNKLAQVSGIK